MRSNSVENTKICGSAVVLDRFTHDKNSTARMNAMTNNLFTLQRYEKNQNIVKKSNDNKSDFRREIRRRSEEIDREM